MSKNYFTNYKDFFNKVDKLKQIADKSKKKLLFIDLNFLHLSKEKNLLEKSQIERMILNYKLFFEKMSNSDDIIYSSNDGEFQAVLSVDSSLDFNSYLTHVLNVHKSHNFLFEAGISVYPKDSTDIEILFKKAKIAKYFTNDSIGYNVFYNDELELILKRRIKIRKDLYYAFSKNELEVFFQPQFLANSKKLCGVEALVRWNHSTLGVISPDEFIPVLERYNLISLLGSFVLRKSLDYFKKIKNINITLSVNVSTVEFSNYEFSKNILEILDEYKFPYYKLILEITETSRKKSESDLFYEGSNFRNNFEKLTSAGISIVLDDYGTGHATESFFIEYPFSGFKLDKSFISNLNKVKYRYHILHLFELAKTLNYNLVVEGVEYKEELDFIKNFKNDIKVQGYYLSKPLNFKDFKQKYFP